MEKNMTYSVQIAPYYSDDVFNGTLAECKEYLDNYFNQMQVSGTFSAAEINEAKEAAQIAMISLDSKGCFDFCQKVIQYIDMDD